MRLHSLLFVSLVAAIQLSTGVCTAQSRNLIERPRAHTPYTFELEPHVGVGGYHSIFGGPGIRGSFPIVDPGFIKSLNNSVAIGSGLDFYFNGNRTHTHDGTTHAHSSDLVVPLVMQWNFWFTREWSAFGEPGALLSISPHLEARLQLVVGGRYQINDLVTLTARLGIPIASFGVSFFL
jgi:hypothetical protein